MSLNHILYSLTPRCLKTIDFKVLSYHCCCSIGGSVSWSSSPSWPFQSDPHRLRSRIGEKIWIFRYRLWVNCGALWSRKMRKLHPRQLLLHTCRTHIGRLEDLSNPFPPPSHILCGRLIGTTSLGRKKNNSRPRDFTKVNRLHTKFRRFSLAFDKSDGRCRT